MKWQPIETFPNVNGTYLVFDERFGNEVIAAEYIHAQSKDNGSGFSCDGQIVRPTHWMPLPPLPEDTP